MWECFCFMCLFRWYFREKFRWQKLQSFFWWFAFFVCESILIFFSFGSLNISTFVLTLLVSLTAFTLSWTNLLWRFSFSIWPNFMKQMLNSYLLSQIISRANGISSTCVFRLKSGHWTFLDLIILNVLATSQSNEIKNVTENQFHCELSFRFSFVFPGWIFQNPTIRRRRQFTFENLLTHQSIMFRSLCPSSIQTDPKHFSSKIFHFPFFSLWIKFKLF